MIFIMQAKGLKKTIQITLVAVFWLAVWQFAAMAAGNELLFPSPLTAAAALLRLAGSGSFWLSIAFSLARIAAGFCLGVAAGCLLAVLTAFIKPLDYLLSPLLSLIRAIPVASFIMLVILLFKRDTLPVFICFLMVVPIVWSNVTLGLKSVTTEQKELIKVYRLSLGKRITKLYIPAVMPYAASSAVTALGFAWKSGIAAEVLCLPKYSIGYMIYQTKSYLLSDELFAWTAVVALLSIVLEKLLKHFLNKISKRRKA